jgi:hypothetical protein
VLMTQGQEAVRQRSGSSSQKVHVTVHPSSSTLENYLQGTKHVRKRYYLTRQPLGVSGVGLGTLNVHENAETKTMMDPSM